MSSHYPFAEHITEQCVTAVLQVIHETIPALQQLKSQGLVRHIGITGLPLKIFSYILDRVEPGKPRLSPDQPG